MTHESVVRGVLAGVALPSDRPRCGDCHAPIRTGAAVVALARKPKGVPSWGIHSVYHSECGPEPLPTMPGGETALAAATLGSLVDTAQQTHQPALVDVIIEDCDLRGEEVRA